MTQSLLVVEALRQASINARLYSLTTATTTSSSSSTSAESTSPEEIFSLEIISESNISEIKPVIKACDEFLPKIVQLVLTSILQHRQEEEEQANQKDAEEVEEIAKLKEFLAQHQQPQQQHQQQQHHQQQHQSSTKSSMDALNNARSVVEQLFNDASALKRQAESNAEGNSLGGEPVV